LSHSRKGHSEAVVKQDTESFIPTLENAFWTLGGVPQRVVFDNAKCAVKTPDWYDPELNPKLVDFCKHYGCAFIPTRVPTPRHKLHLNGMSESLEVRLHEASSTGLTHLEFFELMLQD